QLDFAIAGAGTVLRATWDYEQLSGFERNGAVAQLHVERAVKHQEQFVGLVMLVPDELALDLHQPHFMVVVARDNPRRPMIGEARQLRGNVDLVHGNSAGMRCSAQSLLPSGSRK